MKPGRSVTIDDIAKDAGVSTATVSRALNQPELVRNEARTRVEASIARLGYVRHGAARALASSRSHTVGVVIPTLESAIFSTGVNAMERQLDEAAYTMLLAVSNYDAAQEFRQVRTLLERGVDGMILVGKIHSPETLSVLEQQNCPVVTTWTHDERSRVPCVGFDNRAAATEMTEHLLVLGHTRIGALAGIMEGNDRAQERIEGIRTALRTRSLDLPAHYIVERPYELIEGRTGFRELMNGDEYHRPTAIFCGNDVLAVGALLEAAAMGMEVPNDISIVGFDDLPLASQIDPPLTTVHVPSKRMGAAAADYILNRIQGMKTENHVELPISIEIRGTTAPPRI